MSGARALGTVRFSKSHHSMDPGRSARKVFLRQPLLYLCGLMILCTALCVCDRRRFSILHRPQNVGKRFKAAGSSGLRYHNSRRWYVNESLDIRGYGCIGLRKQKEWQ